MILNNVEIVLLVKGRPITEYAHRGQSFVEGRAGSNYEIEFRNRSRFRVEVILSVDGLSVTDGKEAGPGSSGYVVDGLANLRVPGWTLDRDQVAAFAFAGQEARHPEHRVGYAEQMTGSARNNGVIGALVYSEASTHLMRRNDGVWRTRGVPISTSASSVSSVDPAHAMSWGTVAGSLQASSLPSYLMHNGASTASSVTDTGGFYSFNAAVPFLGVATTESNPASAQALGTAFGAATDFATQSVTFNRADLHAVLEIYYDNARGLKARGIEIIKPSKQRFETRPQAFPGLTVGCTPPPGYRG